MLDNACNDKSCDRSALFAWLSSGLPHSSGTSFATYHFEFEASGAHPGCAKVDTALGHSIRLALTAPDKRSITTVHCRPLDAGFS